MRSFWTGVSALALVFSAPVLADDAAKTYGSFGFDVAGMDRALTPGDDFFGYANGRFMAELEIPADRSGAGVTYMIDDMAREQTRAIIEAAAADRQAAAGSEARKVGDFYASFMDEDAIEAKGMAPVQPLLDRVAAIDSTAALARAFGEAEQMGVQLPVALSIQTDSKNPDAMIARFYQGGLGLPERNYYLDTENPKFAEARAAYLAYATAMFGHAGFGDAAARAAAVMALETKIAKAHWDPVASRDKDKNYTPVARGDLGGRFKGFDWETYLAAVGVAGEQRLVVTQPSAIERMAALVASEPLSVWRDYLALRTLAKATAFLPKRVVDTGFALSSVLSGAKEQRPRWKRGVDATAGVLGEAVGKLYVAKHFPPEAKAAIDAMVTNVIAAMDARLARLDWMAPETRAAAREKLTHFTPKIGYPDQWRDYSGLTVVDGDALGNAMRASQFEHGREVAKLGKPVDRSEWFMAPMEVNAYAYPEWVEIVFPAAILQAPFFDPKADPAVNYGAIGSIIGHELTHHFDDQGRKYDATGKQTDWWTAQDVERFKARAEQLVTQYGAYEGLPGKTVNGELTLGENIADLAGLVVAFEAWKASLGGKPAPVIDGFTGEQRFFLGFAQAWRAKYRDELMLQLLVGDPHSPSKVRPNAARNMDEWYAAFGVKPGDALYLAPADRVKLW